MRFFAALLLLALALGATAVTQQKSKVEVPQLATERDETGARPGTFHFVTNEQTIADAKRLLEAYSAIERLETRAKSAKAEERKQIEADLQVLRTLADTMHERQTTSAGESAAAIEKRLNAAKGKFMCGACHGHGAMMEMHRQ